MSCPQIHGLWKCVCFPLLFIFGCSGPLQIPGSGADAGQGVADASWDVDARPDSVRADCCPLPSGTITAFTRVTPESAPTGIAVGSDGNLWFTENLANQIGRISPTGEITEFLVPTPDSYPRDIAAGPDGNLWFTEVRAKVGRITTAGTITEFETSQRPANIPSDIVAGPDGALWFTGSYGIGRISTSGKVTAFGLPAGLGSLWGIGVGPDGAMWFSSGYPNKLGRVSVDGRITDVALSSSGMEISRGVTRGPDNHLWIAGWEIPLGTGGAIAKVTTSGVVTVFFSREFAEPRSITAGPDQALWFTDWGGAIGRISLEGDMKRFPLPGDMTYPWGIVTGPDGNLWFTYSHGIGRLVP